MLDNTSSRASHVSDDAVVHDDLKGKSVDGASVAGSVQDSDRSEKTYGYSKGRHVLNLYSRWSKLWHSFSVHFPAT